MSQGPLGRCGMCVNTNTGWGHSQHSVLVHICHPSICHPLFWDICHPLFCDICHPLIVISATPFFRTIATRAFATPRNWFSIHKGGSLLCFRHIWFVSGSYYTFYPISKLDNSKLGSTQLFTLICCQDHILTENIWFVWSETSYSGDEMRCHGCGTTTERRTLKIELLSQWKLEVNYDLCQIIFSLRDTRLENTRERSQLALNIILNMINSSAFRIPWLWT